MKHLTDFRIDEELDDCMLPMHLLTDLPFRVLHSWHFIIDEENIHETVTTLSKIKTLNELKLTTDRVTNYKMTPKDFELFKHLPVKEVDLRALDLTKDNLNEFRQIMQGMKIEYIEFNSEHYKDFEITIKGFGPFGSLYSTI